MLALCVLSEHYKPSHHRHTSTPKAEQIVCRNTVLSKRRPPGRRHCSAQRARLENVSRCHERCFSSGQTNGDTFMDWPSPVEQTHIMRGRAHSKDETNCCFPRVRNSRSIDHFSARRSRRDGDSDGQVSRHIIGAALSPGNVRWPRRSSRSFSRDHSQSSHWNLAAASDIVRGRVVLQRRRRRR